MDDEENINSEPFFDCNKYADEQERKRIRENGWYNAEIISAFIKTSRGLSGEDYIEIGYSVDGFYHFIYERMSTDVYGVKKTGNKMVEICKAIRKTTIENIESLHGKKLSVFVVSENYIKTVTRSYKVINHDKYGSKH